MFKEQEVMTQVQFAVWRKSLDEYFNNYDEERYKNDKEYRREFDSLSLTIHDESYADYCERIMWHNSEAKKWQKRFKMFQRASGIILIFMGLLGMAQMVTGNAIVAWVLPEDYTSYPGNLIMSALFVWSCVRLAVFPALMIAGVYCLVGKSKMNQLVDRILANN